MIRWQKLAIYLGAPALILSAVGSTWAIADWLGVRPVLSRELTEVVTQTSANTHAIYLMRWQWLEQKRQSQGLTVPERFEYCSLSKALGFAGVGCA